MTTGLIGKPVEPGTFVASPDGGHWTFTGALTFDTVETVMERTAALPLPTSGRIDLTEIDPADSSALAALFALKRRGRAERKHLKFEGIPEGLASLARVYGVEELLIDAAK